VLVVFLVLQSLGHDDNELRSSSLWFLVILWAFGTTTTTTTSSACYRHGFFFLGL
jgi:hypothetical protein